MEEIAELQQKITAKDAEMAQLNSQHHSKVARLRDENANLQKDLKRAYKLHKQEVRKKETLICCAQCRRKTLDISDGEAQMSDGRFHKFIENI